MRKNLLILLTLFATAQVYAYPIAPQTLRKLIENSQYIIIAIIDNPDLEGEKMKLKWGFESSLC